jgi:hypothetical protein
MQYFPVMLLLTTLLGLGGVLNWLPVVSAGTINIKARNGDAGAPNSLVDTNGKPLRPIFNETRTFEVLQLPQGFSFSDEGRNITREEFGGMVSFSASELDKIPGATVTEVTGSAVLFCQTSDGSPKASDAKRIVVKLSGWGEKWCCQVEPDQCTRLDHYGTAATDICAPYSPFKMTQRCIFCKDAGKYVFDIIDGCTDPVTHKAGGFVRYVSLLTECKHS